MLRHPRVKRPDRFEAEERGERLRGHAATPKGAVDPAIHAAVHAEFVGMAQVCGYRRIKTRVQDLTALSGQVGLRISGSNDPPAAAPDKLLLQRIGAFARTAADSAKYRVTEIHAS
jgi:hypothetical protein